MIDLVPQRDFRLHVKDEVWDKLSPQERVVLREWLDATQIEIAEFMRENSDEVVERLIRSWLGGRDV